MQFQSGKTALNLNIEVENDLEVDSNGRLFVLTLLFPGDKEEPAEVRVEFENIIDNLIEFYKDDSSNIGSGQLYSIAHELTRSTERLREVAGYMEGIRDTDSLFNEDDLDEDYLTPI